jgi:autotransporter-associated beta strand protein
MCRLRCCCVRLLAIVPGILCMITSRASLAVCLAAAGLATLGPRALAADGSWFTDSNGNWSSSGNWLSGVIPGSTTATNSSDIATFSLTIAGNRGVNVDANRNIGGITFSNTSAFAYTLQSGNLLLSNGGVIQQTSAAGSHADIVSSSIAIQGDGGSGTFTASGTNAGNQLLISGNVTGVSTAGNTTTLTLNGDGGSNPGGNGSLAGIISDGSGGGRLAVVQNGGVWRNTGNHTFSGGWTLNQGTLLLNGGGVGTGTFTINGGAIDVTASRVLQNNVAQNWNGDFTFAGSNTLNLGTGAVALGASRTVTVTSSTLTVGGVISGVGFGITKAGAGSLALSGSSTYTGPTVINSGTLSVNRLANGGQASPLGAASNAAANLVIDGGVLEITSTATNTTDRLFTIGSQGATLRLDPGIIASAANFTNTGSIAFSGSGSRTLTLFVSSAGNSGNTISGTLAASIGDPQGGLDGHRDDGWSQWIC